MSGKAHREACDYTVDELMISVLSSFFEDGDQACNGMASFLPVSAFMLARLTHAPGLVWLASATGLEPRPAKVPASTLESQLWSDSIMYMEQYGDFWNFAMNGRWLQKFCVGAAQLDMYGNANNSVIGTDFHAPKVRLPGTAGLGDMDRSASSSTTGTRITAPAASSRRSISFRQPGIWAGVTSARIWV